MQESRIAESRWKEFGERFSRDHQGWRAHIYQLRITDLEQGALAQSKVARMFTDDLPLQEVRAAGDTGEVILTVGADRGETSYLIEDVVAIFSHTGDDRRHELRIDSRGGGCTLVQLHRRDGAQPSDS